MFDCGALTTITPRAVAWATANEQTFGRLMLVVLAVGLAAYALWTFVAAFVDPERKGKSFQGIAERKGYEAGARIVRSVMEELPEALSQQVRRPV